MSDQVQHLLSKHGILSSFNISKRIKKSYINNLKNKLKKTGKSDLEISEEIDRKLILSTQKFIDKHEIPGIHITHEGREIVHFSEKTKNLILQIANKCVVKCRENKLNKEQMIIFMQLFLHLSNITNQDVLNFKKKYGIENADDEDDLEDGDENDEI